MFFGAKSWSQAAVSIRFLPFRENGPTFTPALASNESRNTVGSATAAALTIASWSKMASVKAIFFEVSFFQLCWDSNLILVPTYFVSASLGKGLLPFNDEAISRLRTQLS